MRQKCYRTAPTKGNKITIGCLTPAFSGTQKRAELLRNPCILRGPQQRGQIHNWPNRGRKCYVTLAFSGVPKQGDKIRSQNLHWGQ